jgi:predicted metal-binding protein
MGRWQMVEAITITVCTTCALGQAGFAAALATALPAARIAKVDCMSGCARPSTVAFRSPGKTAYLFGDLTEADLPLLQQFHDLYTQSPDGNFTDARVLGDLRLKAIARIPG